MMEWIALNQSRTFIHIEGHHRLDFIQGLMTQDLRSCDQRVVFGAFLTPKGRFMADAFVMNTPEDGLWLEVSTSCVSSLLGFLIPYGMLHQVTVTARSDHWIVLACVDTQTMHHSISSAPLGQQHSAPSRDPLPICSDHASSLCVTSRIIDFVDPRRPQMGSRAWVPSSLWQDFQDQHMVLFDETVYHTHRMAVGVPDGAWDLVPQQSIILEYGYQHIHALSWTKGCYQGQELMARTHHRGMVRKQLVCGIKTTGNFPPCGTPLMNADLHDVSPHTEGSSELVQTIGRGWMGGQIGHQGLLCLPTDWTSSPGACRLAPLGNPEASFVVTISTSPIYHTDS